MKKLKTRVLTILAMALPIPSLVFAAERMQLNRGESMKAEELKVGSDCSNEFLQLFLSTNQSELSLEELYAQFSRCFSSDDQAVVDEKFKKLVEALIAAGKIDGGVESLGGNFSGGMDKEK